MTDKLEIALTLYGGTGLGACLGALAAGQGRRLEGAILGGFVGLEVADELLERRTHPRVIDVKGEVR